MSSLTTLFGGGVSKRASISLSNNPVSQLVSFPDISIVDNKIDGSIPIGITYSGSLYVMVAQSNTGTVKTSPDGVTWTVRTPPTCSYIASVAYGAGFFIALGTYSGDSKNYIFKSTDGITWTLTGVQPEATNINYYAKVFDGGNCVLYAGTDASQACTFYKSTNGTTWTPFAYLNTGSASGTGVPRANAGFVDNVNGYRFLGVVCNYYTSSTSFHQQKYSHYSSNGTTWTAMPTSAINSETVISVIYNNSYYYLYTREGSIYKTSDWSTYTAVRKWNTTKLVISLGTYGGAILPTYYTTMKLLNKFMGLSAVWVNSTPWFQIGVVSDPNYDMVTDIYKTNIQSLIGQINANAIVVWYTGVSLGTKHYFYKTNSSIVCIDGSAGNEIYQP